MAKHDCVEISDQVRLHSGEARRWWKIDEPSEVGPSPHLLAIANRREQEELTRLARQPHHPCTERGLDPGRVARGAVSHRQLE